MSKIKIEIKNKLTGKILFEYEKENNTVKDTIEEAIKQDAYLEGADLRGTYLGGADLRGTYLRGADLRGAYLRSAYLEGADLRGADLGGAYLRGADLEDADLRSADLRGADLYMWDDDNVDIKEIIENVENNSNIKIKNYYINKHILSPVTKVYWKNGLIIDEYEIIDKNEEQNLDKTEEKPKKIDDFVTEYTCSNLDFQMIDYLDKIKKAVNYLLEKSDRNE